MPQAANMAAEPAINTTVRLFMFCHHPVARRLAVGDRVQAALRKVRAPAGQVQQPESLLAGHVERT